MEIIELIAFNINLNEVNDFNGENAKMLAASLINSLNEESNRVLGLYPYLNRYNRFEDSAKHLNPRMIRWYVLNNPDKISRDVFNMAFDENLSKEAFEVVSNIDDNDLKKKMIFAYLDKYGATEDIIPLLPLCETEYSDAGFNTYQKYITNEDTLAYYLAGKCYEALKNENLSVERIKNIFVNAKYQVAQEMLDLFADSSRIELQELHAKLTAQTPTLQPGAAPLGLLEEYNRRKDSAKKYPRNKDYVEMLEAEINSHEDNYSNLVQRTERAKSRSLNGTGKHETYSYLLAELTNADRYRVVIEAKLVAKTE